MPRARTICPAVGDISLVELGLGSQVLPVALLIEPARTIVAVHHAAGRGRFFLNIRIGIQLGKKLLHITHTGSKHQGLVAIIARTDIPAA